MSSTERAFYEARAKEEAWIAQKRAQKRACYSAPNYRRKSKSNGKGDGVIVENARIVDMNYRTLR